MADQRAASEDFGRQMRGRRSQDDVGIRAAESERIDARHALARPFRETAPAWSARAA